jgi:hypothetical protein
MSGGRDLVLVMAQSPFCRPSPPQRPVRSHDRVPMGRERNTGRRSDIRPQRASMTPCVPSQDLIRLRKLNESRCDLVAAFRRGLKETGFALLRSHLETRILKIGDQTRAGNWSDVAQNPENCASKIPQRFDNSRECSAYFCEPDIAYRNAGGVAALDTARGELKPENNGPDEGVRSEK